MLGPFGAESYSARGVCVLVSSSNAATGEFFKRELERSGHEVICVKPGMALESIPESSSVDIAVIDMFDDISIGEYLELELLKKRYIDLSIIAVGRKREIESACVLVEGNFHYVKGLDNRDIVQMLRAVVARK